MDDLQYDDYEERTNPFPGLRAFEPDEEHLFFGREKQVDELLSLLKSSRFIAVMGASGSGKSSIVRSGLIPALYSGYMVRAGSSWRVAVMRPGDNPVGNLAEGLNDPDVFGGEHPETTRGLTEATLWRSSMGLVETVDHSDMDERENLLILVDQFEELFRFKRENTRGSAIDEATAFVRLLLDAAAQEEKPIYIVLTMRSDFLGNCTEFKGLTEAINRGHYLVPRMSRDDKKLAITGPVAVGGAEITPRLLSRLLNDVGDNPDQLPILQHALMRTWDYWETHHSKDDPLDLRHYEAIGAMREALSMHAEEAWRELDSDELRMAAERLFQTITNKGRDGRGVRNPSRICDISKITEIEPALLVRVAEIFRKPGRSFLMPPASHPIYEETTVDISHESLMRVWNRLRDWVDDNAQAAELYRRLAVAAERYESGEAGLWKDPELQLALRWREEHQPTIGWASRYDPAFERAMLFLDKSKAERDAEIEQRERLRQRALKRTRILAVIFAAASFLILFLMLQARVANSQARDALEAARKAEQDARASAQEARDEKKKTDEALKKANEQKQKADDARKEAELLKDESDSNADAARQAEREARRQQQEANKQAQIAQEARDKAVKLQMEADKARDEAEKKRIDAIEAKEDAIAAKELEAQARKETERLSRIEAARSLAIQSATQSRGDSQLGALIALEAYQLYISNQGVMPDPSIHEALQLAGDNLGDVLPAPIAAHQDAIRGLTLTGGGDLISVGDDQSVRVLSELSNTKILRQAKARIRDLDLSGEKLATVLMDGRVLGWSYQDGSLDSVFDRSFFDGMAYAVAILDDQVYAAGEGGYILRSGWNSEEQPEIFAHTSSDPLVLAVSREKKIMAAGYKDGEIRIWNLPDSQITHEFSLDGEIRSLAFSPGAKYLAAGMINGEILLYDLSQTEAPRSRFVGHEAGVNDLVFDQTRDFLYSVSFDNTLRIWTLASPDQLPVVLRGHNNWIWSIAYDPNSRLLYTGGADGRLHIWHCYAEDIATRISQSLTRGMTRDEWERFMPEGMEFQPQTTGPSRGRD